MSKAVFHPGISGYFLLPLRRILYNLYKLYFPFFVISKRISQRTGQKYFSLQTLSISEKCSKARVGIQFFRCIVFPKNNENVDGSSETL